jgi:hypothetical protein
VHLGSEADILTIKILEIFSKVSSFFDHASLHPLSFWVARSDVIKIVFALLCQYFNFPIAFCLIK